MQYQITGTPKPLANPTECHAAWENATLFVALNSIAKWNRKENANAERRSQLVRNNKAPCLISRASLSQLSRQNEIQNQKFHSWGKKRAGYCALPFMVSPPEERMISGENSPMAC